jgi:hypothetical protein
MFNKDTFEFFKPGLWQNEGFFTESTPSEPTPTKYSNGRKTKWVVAATAIALSATIMLAPESFVATSIASKTPSASVVTKAHTVEHKVPAVKSDVPAGYFAALIREMRTWPEIESDPDFENEPDPLA